MIIKFRLQEILERYGLQKTPNSELAKITGYEERKIKDMRDGIIKHIDLEKMQKLCTWLEENHVPIGEILGGLFAPENLWDQILRSSHMEMIIGETLIKGKEDFVRAVVASLDTQVVLSITQQLTHQVNRAFDLKSFLIPWREGETVPDANLKQAVKHFDDMRKRQSDRKKPSTVFLVGSNRINPCTEQLVAEIFGLEPFDNDPTHRKPPFYLKYRDTSLSIPSCFGGMNTAPGWVGAPTDPGITFHGPNGWKHLSVSDNTDAGMVIVSFNPQFESLEIALFGFSARATQCVGHYFLNHADAFWPGNVRFGPRWIGVHVCALKRATTKHEFEIEDIAIPDKILVDAIDAGRGKA